MFRWLFVRREDRDRADRIAAAIAAQARRPVFYLDCQVPDTLDGRFDLLVLHAAIVLPVLARAGGERARLAQEATDSLFVALEEALRAEGIGDGGVPRRMKAMGRAYLGRLKAYDEALAAGDPAALAEAVRRNLFRGTASGSESLLAAYMLAERRRFQGHDWEAAKAGDLGFREPERTPA